MLDIAAVFAATGQRSIVVPRPHPELVTRRVLVMEHLHGFAWGNAAGMRAAGIDTAAVLRSSLIAFLEGALLYGVFHGDLHGGNLMVQARRDRGPARLRDHRPARRAQAPGLPPAADGGHHQQPRRPGGGPAGPGRTAGRLRRRGGHPRSGSGPAAARPTTLTADEMVAELRDVTKALLGYGARLPKELMLFVKDILFLNGAMATMAPDVDILGEILAVVTYFTERHGERIARDVGVELLESPDRPRRLPGGHGLPRGDRSDHLPRPAGAPGADPPAARSNEPTSAAAARWPGPLPAGPPRTPTVEPGPAGPEPIGRSDRRAGSAGRRSRRRGPAERRHEIGGPVRPRPLQQAAHQGRPDHHAVGHLGTPPRPARGWRPRSRRTPAGR